MSEHKCRCAGCTKAKKAGAAEERERIIALLETINAEPDGVTWDMAIALIKGENE